MSTRDSYHAYTEGNVFDGSPLEMVVALYEGTIEAIRQARHYLTTDDVWGRSRAINKGLRLLTELLVSLEHPEGNEISGNLKALYSYLQARLLDAHANKTAKPLDEAERLMTTMLEGWREAAQKAKAEAHGPRSGLSCTNWDSARGALPGSGTPHGMNLQDQSSQDQSWNYGIFAEMSEFAGGVSAVF